MTFNINNIRIGIIGLGYVGLPLAVEFGRKYPTVGFDINTARVEELKAGTDTTLECSREELEAADQLTFSSSVDAIADCNFYIVTVPTPIGDSNRPILTPLRSASVALGGIIKTGDVVVYESTVYPGATEEFCVPLIEE
ncbi:MAG: Vi polysaccharide biosynthesis UDP-N-acetylglucosamine C-6 dehydrogenase TviB, partial [Gammaproteobacteria bacterium]|nr:Vi polysaccharide biosynthesis UDP-N-acetylglucosamine C-6 dehydrogenase TviB [Gammaproteobacteria bacterium]